MLTSVLDGPAGSFKDAVTYGLLNPLQSLLAESPWWLAFAGLLALAIVIGGRRAVLPTVICLAGIYLLDLWNDTMVVLNMTLVATLLVMVLALVFGVWMARSRSRRPGHPTAARRRTDHPGVRLPDPGARPLRPDALHRDRGRHRLRRAGGDQAGRRRCRRVSPGGGGGRPFDGVDDVAGDHQGAAADGQGLAGAGDQPGPSLRPGHGGHRWPRRGGCPRATTSSTPSPTSTTAARASQRLLDRAARHPDRPGGPRSRRTRRRRVRDVPRPRTRCTTSDVAVTSGTAPRDEGQETTRTRRRTTWPSNNEGENSAASYTRRRLRLAVVVASAALALTACGSGSVADQTKENEDKAAASGGDCGDFKISSTRGSATPPTPTSSARGPGGARLQRRATSTSRRAVVLPGRLRRR